MALQLRADKAYHTTGGRSLTIEESDILEVLADTGWYGDNNQDCEPASEGSARYRYVRIAAEDEPVLLFDAVSRTTPGGSINFSGKGPGYIPAKDRTPYLHQWKRVTNSYEAQRDFIEDVVGKKVTDKLHPRFTRIKDVLRKIWAHDRRVSKLVDAARKRIEKDNPFDWESLKQ